jgi:hypothetical protein
MRFDSEEGVEHVKRLRQTLDTFRSENLSCAKIKNVIVLMDPRDEWRQLWVTDFGPILLLHVLLYR